MTRSLVVALALASGCARFHSAPVSGAPSDATFVEVDGLSLHYRELGPKTAPVVVLIHGYSASLENWSGVQESLARHFRVIAFDLPGFGLSERPRGELETYGPIAIASRLWAALDKLGVSETALVGHSWGASVVLTMTVTEPARVNRVALYSAYVFDEQVPSFLRWAQVAGLGEVLFGMFYDERAEDRAALAYHDHRYVTQDRVDRVEHELSKPGAAAAALAVARGHQFEQLEKRWSSVAQPTLIVWGANDMVTPVRFGYRLAALLPAAELEVYQACGHVPMIEARLPTTRALVEFMLAGSAEPSGVEIDLPEPAEKVDIDPRDYPPLRSAADLAELGSELAPRRYASPRQSTEVVVSGQLRARGEHLYNLDLDRGLDPSGRPVFAVPADGGQSISTADARMRTDLAIYAPGSGVAVKSRVDVLDNVVLGSTPIVGTGVAPTPAAAPGQSAAGLRVERVWGEALTPFGVLAVGRMGAHFGLGMTANGGDCDDCDGGDAADRVAFVMPWLDHLWALSYDFTWSGPVTERKDESRSIELAETDDVHTVTFTLLRARTPASIIRRAAAGRTTIEYGAYVSHRWQADDVPAAYLPVASPVAIDGAQLMARDFRATSTGAWMRLLLPAARVELEATYAHARVGQPSLIPGIELTQEATSNQLGLALESDVRLGRFGVGVDGGYASGDDAPGFGAFPAAGAAAPEPGDLDGPQADLPGDTTVDNFRFHPDYRIDRILFREILGTVTDAVYLRPHASVRLFELGRTAWLEGQAALIASWAAEAASTPTGSRALGIEIDPGLAYYSIDGFRAALEYAVLFPGAAFDNPAVGLEARTAQSVRLRVGYLF